MQALGVSDAEIFGLSLGQEDTDLRQRGHRGATHTCGVVWPGGAFYRDALWLKYAVLEYLTNLCSALKTAKALAGQSTQHSLAKSGSVHGLQNAQVV